MAKVKSKRSLESFITELESIKEDLIGRNLTNDKSNYFKDEDLIVKINDAFNTIEDCLNEQLNEGE
jgi:hypothetical protein